MYLILTCVALSICQSVAERWKSQRDSAVGMGGGRRDWRVECLHAGSETNRDMRTISRDPRMRAQLSQRRPHGPTAPGSGVAREPGSKAKSVSRLRGRVSLVCNESKLHPPVARTSDGQNVALEAESQ